jgi:hypothetical protein
VGMDGVGARRGRLYEVGPDGLARSVSTAARAADEAHLCEARPGALPVSDRRSERAPGFGTRACRDPTADLG